MKIIYTTKEMTMREAFHGNLIVIEHEKSKDRMIVERKELIKILQEVD